MSSSIERSVSRRCRVSRRRPRLSATAPRPAAAAVFAVALLVGGPLAAPLLGQGPAVPPIISAPYAAGSTAIVGRWQGRLSAPDAGASTLVIHVEITSAGALGATLDSPDQGTRGVRAELATFEGARLVVEIQSLRARFEGTLRADGRLVGTWSRGAASLPLELERAGGPAPPNRPQKPEPPFPYRVEEVRYRNDEADITLSGTLSLPEGEGPFPAVALVSGSGPHDRDSELFGHRVFVVLADYLTRQGIAVLRSDDRGVGASDGVFREATTLDFAGDAAAAAAYLRARPEIREDGVGLLGLGEGGLVAPLVALRAEPLAFVVLMGAPGLPGEDVLYRRSGLISRAMGAADEQTEWNRTLQERAFAIVKEEADPAERAARLLSLFRGEFARMTDEERRLTGLTRDAEDGWIQAQLRNMGGPGFRFVLVHDPRPVLHQVRVPVLALTGSLDLEVPAAANLPAIEGALRDGGNRDVTVVELPGLNHLFQTATTGAPAEYARIDQTMSPAAMEQVASWIRERSAPLR